MNEYVTKDPPKLLFVNLVSGDELPVQFNPTQLREAIEANYSRVVVPGQSHAQMQFINTDNFKIDLELFFRAVTKQELELIHRARRQILSWAYPRMVANDIVGGGAPKLLLYWPSMLSVECVLASASFTHERFNNQARSVQFTCAVQLEEMRNVRLHFDEVAEDNVLRFGSDLGLEEEG